MIYLDHHSATRPCSSALERMEPYFEEHWGSSLSPHRFGQQMLQGLDLRYQTIYDFVGADRKNLFVFTSSGAEAINQVFWSIFLEVARKEGKCHLITSCIEDAPTMQCCKRFEELGCFVKIAPINTSGQIDVEKLADLINPRTALISVTLAHGLTGVIQPIEEIARIAREKKVLLHIDATYALGKYSFSFDELGADFLTFSGDRIHALKGSGGLFVKEGSPLVPLILGGTEQGGFRGGAFDAPSFMALVSAMQQSSLFLDTMTLEVARLRDLLENEIIRIVPDARALFKTVIRLPNTTALVFPKVHQEALLYLLSRKGVYGSIGGAYCQHLSRTLIAANSEGAESAVSFSLSRMTTEEEVIQAAHIIGETALYLQTVSEDLFS
ncbi:MAG: aminotransferase class V-fold PLP-dependent enzyme [Chlamydiota bacterium]